jgi:hypothetical protein
LAEGGGESSEGEFGAVEERGQRGKKREGEEGTYAVLNVARGKRFMYVDRTRV